LRRQFLRKCRICRLSEKKSTLQRCNIGTVGLHPRRPTHPK
jgi:hypothetical protein